MLFFCILLKIEIKIELIDIKNGECFYTDCHTLNLCAIINSRSRLIKK